MHGLQQHGLVTHIPARQKKQQKTTHFPISICREYLNPYLETSGTSMSNCLGLEMWFSIRNNSYYGVALGYEISNQISWLLILLGLNNLASYTSPYWIIIIYMLYVIYTYFTSRKCYLIVVKVQIGHTVQPLFCLMEGPL